MKHHQSLHVCMAGFLPQVAAVCEISKAHGKAGGTVRASVQIEAMGSKIKSMEQVANHLFHEVADEIGNGAVDVLTAIGEDILV